MDLTPDQVETPEYSRPQKATKEESIHRLTLLADMLDRHAEIFPDVTLDLCDWVNKYASCGTTACAVGSACSYAPFNELGLSLFIEEDTIWAGRGQPHYKGLLSWDAVECFFGLTDPEGDDLFMTGGYQDFDYEPTPKDVADKVREFIEKLKRR